MQYTQEVRVAYPSFHRGPLQYSFFYQQKKIIWWKFLKKEQVLVIHLQNHHIYKQIVFWVR